MIFVTIPYQETCNSFIERIMIKLQCSLLGSLSKNCESVVTGELFTICNRLLMGTNLLV